MSGRNADYMIRGGLVVRGSGITREDIVVEGGLIRSNDVVASAVADAVVPRYPHDVKELAMRISAPSAIREL